jgi:3-hydroxyisobutyrate dehydrogenase
MSADNNLPKVGIVGVGRMGANMARRLADCGYSISGLYDVNPNSANTLATQLNTQAFECLAKLTQTSDVILTVVSDDAAMEAIYHHPDDNLFQHAQGKTFINFATITPQVHIDLMQVAKSLNAAMIEAPMASSIPQAREGTLFLMVAGDSDTIQANTALLSVLSKEFIYTGPAGSAAKIKALVNMVMNMNTAALAEGLGLAQALDLDLGLVQTIFAKTGANSRVLETDAEDMMKRDHDAYFSAAHAAKDSGIALKLGESQQLEMVLAKATYQQYQRLTDLGLGHLDKSGIAELTFKARMPKAVQKVI